MRIILITMVLYTLMAAGEAYCASFMVVAVRDDASAAFLLDQDTGREWEVAAGDMIDQWTVEEITIDSITLSQPGDDGMVLTTVIPASPAPVALPVISVRTP